MTDDSGRRGFSAVEATVSLSSPAGERTVRNRRWLYGTTSLVLTLILGLAVVGAVGAPDVYGVDTAWARAEGGGYRLEVRYPSVSRPALASPFDVVVTRAGGFDGPVTLAVSRRYIAMWDSNGLFPQPSSETATADRLLWEFDPPDGDTLPFSFDARIEPGVQDGRSGSVAVLEDGVAVVGVRFSTRIMP